MIVENAKGRVVAIGDGSTLDFYIDFSIVTVSPGITPYDVLSVFGLVDGVQKKYVPTIDYDIILPDRIQFAVPPEDGERLTFLLQPPAIQTTEYSSTGPFYPKSHEAALDYIQRTNISQEYKFQRLPQLHESANIAEPINPKEFKRYIPGVDEEGDGWKFYDPSEIGAIKPDLPPGPPDFDAYIDRFAYFKSAAGSQLVVSYALMEFKQTYISSLVDLYVNGLFRITQNANAHNITFSNFEYDINFNFSPISSSGIMTVSRIGNTYSLASKLEEVQITSAKQDYFVKFSADSGPTYQLGNGSFYEIVGSLISEKPLELVDTLTFNSSTKNTIQFSASKGDYTIVFDTDPTLTQGIMYYDSSGSNIFIRGFEIDLATVVKYPSPTNNFVPKVADEDSTTLENSSISDDGTTVNIGNDFSIQGKSLAFTPGLDFNLTQPGTLVCTDIQGDVATIEVAPSNGYVHYPAPTLGALPKVSNAITKELDDSSISEDSGVVTVDATLTTNALNIKNTTNTHGISFVDTPQNVIFNLAESGIALVTKSGDDYTIEVTDLPAGVGDVLYPSPTVGAVPRVLSDTSKTLEDSNITDDGSTVNITSAFTIVGNRIGFLSNNDVLFNISRNGIVIATEESPGEFSLSAVDVPEGGGTVTYPGATDNYIPKVLDGDQQILVDSIMLSAGDTVTITGNLNVAADINSDAIYSSEIYEQGTNFAHRLTFDDTIASDITFAPTDSGVATITKEDNNYTITNAQLHTSPTLNAIPKVTLEGSTGQIIQYSDSSITDSPTQVEISKPVVANDYLEINNSSNAYRLSFDGTEDTNYTFNVSESGFLSAEKIGQDIVITSTDTPPGGGGDITYPNPTVNAIPVVSSADPKELADSPLSLQDTDIAINDSSLIINDTPEGTAPITLFNHPEEKGILFSRPDGENKEIYFQKSTGAYDLVFAFSQTDLVENGVVTIRKNVDNGRVQYYLGSRSILNTTLMISEATGTEPKSMTYRAKYGINPEEGLDVHIMQPQRNISSGSFDNITMVKQSYNYELYEASPDETIVLDYADSELYKVRMGGGNLTIALTDSGYAETNNTRRICSLVLETPDDGALTSITWTSTGVTSGFNIIWQEGVVFDGESVSTIPGIAFTLTVVTTVVAGTPCWSIFLNSEFRTSQSTRPLFYQLEEWENLIEGSWSYYKYSIPYICYTSTGRTLSNGLAKPPLLSPVVKQVDYGYEELDHAATHTLQLGGNYTITYSGDTVISFEYPALINAFIPTTIVLVRGTVGNHTILFEDCVLSGEDDQELGSEVGDIDGYTLYVFRSGISDLLLSKHVNRNEIEGGRKK